MPTRRALMDIINKQRQWIEACEANGISYANGERGMAIRQADENYLRTLEARLAEYLSPAEPLPWEREVEWWR